MCAREREDFYGDGWAGGRRGGGFKEEKLLVEWLVGTLTGSTKRRKKARKNNLLRTRNIHFLPVRVYP